jgi:hypothetical protein
MASRIQPCRWPGRRSRVEVRGLRDEKIPVNLIFSALPEAKLKLEHL